MLKLNRFSVIGLMGFMLLMVALFAAILDYKFNNFIQQTREENISYNFEDENQIEVLPSEGKPFFNIRNVKGDFQIPYMWDEKNVSPKIWTSSNFTISGLTDFYLIINETVIFNEILHVLAVAHSPNVYAYATIDTIDDINNKITVKVVAFSFESNSITLAPDGTIVYCQVIGH
jgi:hypothetical protein